MSANKKVFIKSKLIGLFTFGFLSSILSAAGIVGIGSLVDNSKNLSLSNKTISEKMSKLQSQLQMFLKFSIE